MHYFGLLVHESGQVTPLFGTEVHLRLIKSASPKFPSEICLDKNLLVSGYNLQVENYQ